MAVLRRMFFFAVVALSFSRLSQADSAFLELGVPSGISVNSVVATGVSRDGSTVIGEVTIPAAVWWEPDRIEAFRWTETHGFELLGTFPHGRMSRAHATNADGTVIVGESSYGDPLDPEYSSLPTPFRWSSQTGLLDLGTLPSPWNGSTSATIVSDDGTIIAGESRSSLSPLESAAFRWTASTGMTELTPRLEHQEYRPVSISADGAAILGKTLAPERTFRWTPQLGVHILLPGLTSHSFLSGDGQTVASTRWTWQGITWIPQGFRWREGSGESPIPLWGARAISHDGSIVAGEAMLWSESGGTVALTDHIQSFGITVTGWSALTITGMSADGSVLTGYGYHNGQQRAWMFRGSRPEIEFVDPNPYSDQGYGAPLPLITYSAPNSPTASVSFTPSALASRRTVEGVAADGVTRIAIRWPVPGPGVVSFELKDENGHSTAVGLLGALAETPSAATIQNVEAVALGGSWFAFASYSPPHNFDRSANDHTRFSRPVTVSAVFTSQGGGVPITSSGRLNLIRPPVLFVHGLWGSAASWNLDIQRDQRLITYAMDYASSNQSAFQSNLPMVRDGVMRAKRNAHRRGFAATRVTVVGHSMGGLLARLHAANRGFEYYRADNLGQGDFYKLVTLYSPHHGSPLACVLQSLHQWALEEGILEPADCLNCGAFTNLRPDSDAIQTLPAIQVPTHVIAGVGGEELLSQIRGWTAKCGRFGNKLCRVVSRLSAFATGLYELMEMTPHHDLVVKRASALGGVSGAATQEIELTLHPGAMPLGTHFVENQHLLGQDTILPLILARLDSPVFAAGMAQNVNVPVPSVACGSSPLSPPSRSLSGEIFLDVEETPQFEAGSSARLELSVTGNFQPVRISIVSELGFTEVDSLPAVINFPIPADAIGSYTLQAIAVDAAGSYLTSSNIEIMVASSAELENLEVMPQWVGLGCNGETATLTVNGHFTGGIVRNLTASGTGTTYESTNTGVATVNAEGVITARGTGETVVTIRNGERTTSAEVVVASTWCNRRTISTAEATQSLRAAVATACPIAGC